jgi:oligopeptide transport system substrate-binding protein
MFNRINPTLCFMIAAASCCSLLFADTDSQEKIIPELQDNFTIIDTVHQYDLNPHTASYSSETQILTGIYEGLFSYDPVTLEPQPALATNYHISRDKLRWTFTLRPGATFSDGSPITAETVRTSWLNLISTPHAPYASLFDVIEGAKEYRTGSGKREAVSIRATDDTTLTVRLVTPASHLPRILCQSAFSIVKDDLGVFSGPFVIAERSDNLLTLKKNEKYWDVQNTHFEKITIIQSDNTADNAYKFNTGDADWITGSADPDKLLNPKAIQLNAEFGTQYLFFKKNGKTWDNPAFRRALLEAVPWDKLRAGSFVRATTLVYPLEGYPVVEGYSYTDSDEALSLMKQARIDGNIPADQKLTLTFAIPDSDYMKNQAQLLKDAWTPLGVELIVQKTTPERYLPAIETWDADLFSYNWIGDFADPLAFLELFRSDSTLNVTGWTNSTYDKLLNDAALSTDENHYKLLAQAEQLLLDSCIILPVSHPVSLNIIDLNTMGGWSANSFNIHPFKYLFRRKTQNSVPNLI